MCEYLSTRKLHSIIQRFSLLPANYWPYEMLAGSVSSLWDFCAHRAWGLWWPVDPAFDWLPRVSLSVHVGKVTAPPGVSSVSVLQQAGWLIMKRTHTACEGPPKHGSWYCWSHTHTHTHTCKHAHTHTHNYVLALACECSATTSNLFFFHQET